MNLMYFNSRSIGYLKQFQHNLSFDSSMHFSMIETMRQIILHVFSTIVNCHQHIWWSLGVCHTNLQHIFFITHKLDKCKSQHPNVCDELTMFHIDIRPLQTIANVQKHSSSTLTLQIQGQMPKKMVHRAATKVLNFTKHLYS